MYETLLMWKGEEVKFKKPENPLTEREIKTIFGKIFLVLSLVASVVAITVKILN